jgi:hypothetical protein
MENNLKDKIFFENYNSNNIISEFSKEYYSDMDKSLYDIEYNNKEKLSRRNFELSLKYHAKKNIINIRNSKTNDNNENSNFEKGNSDFINEKKYLKTDKINLIFRYKAFEEIKNHFETIYPKSTCSLDYIEKGNTAITLKFDKRKKIHQTMNQLKVGLEAPQIIKNKIKSDNKIKILYFKSKKIINNKNPHNNIIADSNSKPQISFDITPIEINKYSSKKISFDLIDATNVSIKDASNELENFLINRNDFNGGKFCFIINELINLDNVWEFNENVLNNKVFEAIKELRKDQNFRDIELISIDNPMKHVIDEFKLEFRIDLIIYFNNILYIFEFKIRTDRKNKCDEALRCIRYRKYGQRLIDFFKSHKDPRYIILNSKITHIMQVGITRSKFSDLETEFGYELYDRLSMEMDEFKNRSFIYKMKRNKRRFGERFIKNN